MPKFQILCYVALKTISSLHIFTFVKKYKQFVNGGFLISRNMLKYCFVAP